MAVTQDEVRRLARLARLHLAEEELPRLEAELTRIVDYVTELGSVDTGSLGPDPSLGPEVAPLRADVPHQTLSHDAALAGAPRTADGSFAVPAFVDES